MKTLQTNKTILTLALAMGVTLLPTLSQAQETPNQDDSSYSAVYAGKLTQIGSPTDNLTPLKGFAKDLPLITVMRQITPNGWVVKKDDNTSHPLDTQMSVSWSGGKTWIDTLGALASNYKLNIVVNWDSKEITLSPAKPNLHAVEEHKESIFELDDGSAPVVHAQTVTVVKKEIVKEVVVPVKPVVIAQAVPTKPIVPVPTWVEDSTKSLKDNVTAWGKKAGFEVKWTGTDYPVDSRVLTGQFDGDAGPIKQLAEDYGPNSRVEKPLTFQFYQNRTLVVEDWKFSQSTLAVPGANDR